MLTLTYLSDARTRFGLEDLHELLVTSRQHNQDAAVTGMLLFARGHFIQTLEGAEPDVEATFGRIAEDPRHDHIITAHRGDIADRAFADWSMGFRQLDDQQVEELEGLNDFFDPDSTLYAATSSMGLAGRFHRIFRDTAPTLPD